MHEQCKPDAFSPPSPLCLGVRLGICGLFLLHIPSNSMHNCPSFKESSDGMTVALIASPSTKPLSLMHVKPDQFETSSWANLSCLLHQSVFHLHSSYSPLLGNTLTPSLGCSPQFEPSQTCSVEVGGVLIVTVTLRHWAVFCLSALTAVTCFDSHRFSFFLSCLATCFPFWSPDSHMPDNLSWYTGNNAYFLCLQEF